MEPASSRFPNFLSSETLKVQSRNKNFFAHSDILASQPNLLDNTTADGATGKKVDLSDWDSYTVERLLEFLYLRDYQVPQPAPGSGVPKEGDGDEFGGESDEETERLAEVIEGKIQDMAVPEEIEFEDMGANTLLVHAKLYSLAQNKGIEALRVLALERLGKELEKNIENLLEETSGGMTDFIGLLEYIYSQTGPYMGSEEPARSLVLNFTANNFKRFASRPEMICLLCKGGEFVAELMGEVAKRLCDVGGVCKIERELQDQGVRTATLDKVQLYVVNPKMQRPGAVSELRAEVQAMEEQTRGLKERIRKLERMVRKLRVSNAEKVQELGVANAEIQKLQENVRELYTPNTAEMQKLEDSMWRLEEHVQKSGAATTEQVRHLETITAEEIWRLKAEVRWLESTVKWFEVACPDKAREFESANAVKIQSLEASMKHLEALVNWFEATNLGEELEPGVTGAAEIQEFEDNAVKLLGCEAANVAKVRGFGVADAAKIELLESKVHCFKVKLDLFKAAYPGQIPQPGRRRSLIGALKGLIFTVCSSSV